MSGVFSRRGIATTVARRYMSASRRQSCLPFFLDVLSSTTEIKQCQSYIATSKSSIATGRTADVLRNAFSSIQCPTFGDDDGG
mmetsp:Transcript_20858/g.27043  ORF Transcript_20858/g.27043 Transcript_20858/m.27043 type:complete len:83 (+) Transcript_20858:742-990(+)